jgi:LysR family transcriptional regulator, glycine cleavage system transcriptional activator
VSRSHRLPRRKLPPLGAIRAFEATARLGSTVAAASELGVTHGAVSRQIKTLEDRLSRPLFNREGGRLVLTKLGKRYAGSAQEAFDLLDAATRELTGDAADPVVRVSTTASFAAKWLLPRLPRFRARHREIEVWVLESQRLVEPRPGGASDLAIRMGTGPWHGVEVEPLMDDALFPVCAPALAPGLARPADLAKATLLHDDDPQAAWSHWLAAVGLAGRSYERGPRFASTALLLQAAVDGQSVALARTRLAAPDLEAGHLVRPFAEAVPTGPAYWLVTPTRGTPSRAPLLRMAQAGGEGRAKSNALARRTQRTQERNDSTSEAMRR